MFGSFDFQEFLSAFIVLFAVIDIIGSIPIILNLKQKGRNVNANKATGISFALLIGFFYAGDMMLKLFQVDIASFAVAGAFVIFLMSLEMILDIEIFKNQGPIKEATLVPLVFPLLAGAGAFTTLLSLRSEYAPVNIVVALILNMVWVYVVLKLTDRIERFLGKGGIYVIRKFLVIILLAVLFSLLKYRQVKRRRARQLARKRKKALERRRSNTEQTGENAFRRQSSAGRRKNTQIRNRQVDDRRSGSYRRRDREGRYR